jgi:hypothetical protein
LVEDKLALAALAVLAAVVLVKAPVLLVAEIRLQFLLLRATTAEMAVAHHYVEAAVVAEQVRLVLLAHQAAMAVLGLLLIQ